MGPSGPDHLAKPVIVESCRQILEGDPQMQAPLPGPAPGCNRPSTAPPLTALALVLGASFPLWGSTPASRMIRRASRCRSGLPVLSPRRTMSIQSNRTESATLWAMGFRDRAPDNTLGSSPRLKEGLNRISRAWVFHSAAIYPVYHDMVRTLLLDLKNQDTSAQGLSCFTHAIITPIAQARLSKAMAGTEFAPPLVRTRGLKHSAITI